MCSQLQHRAIGIRAQPSHQLFALAFLALIAATARATDQPASPSPQPVLDLADGRSTAGEVRASTQPGVLRWQSASADRPSEFAWNEVNAIEWPPPATRPKPIGDFRFELAAGDVLFGSLMALDDQRAELDVPRLGRIHVRRSNLHRIDRWRNGADLIYVGPNGLAGWQEPAGRKDWRADAGRPITDREGAPIRGNFGLPPRASIEFEVSWRSKADFAFAVGVGVDDQRNTVKRAFQFQAWGEDLIVERELDQMADLAKLQKLSSGPGRVHLQVYLDQEKGRILVFSPGGKELAHLEIPDPKFAALPAVYLENLRGDLRLDCLRIGRWNGEIPRDMRADQARIDLADGTIVYGQLSGLHPASQEFVMTTAKGESRVPEKQVSSVLLSVPKDDAPRTIRTVCQDGSRISGEPVKFENGVLTLTVPGIQEPLQLPLAGLRSLVVLQHKTPAGKGDRGKVP